MEKGRGYKIIEGHIPVLLSAPHVHSHKRPSLTMSYKLGEPYTDNIVEEICLNTGAWGIVQNEETIFDPNYHRLEDNPYKMAVTELVRDEKIDKFIDIHGLSNEYKYDIGIYYPSKFFKSIKLAQDLSEILNNGELRGNSTCILRFSNDLQQTLGEYVASQLRVPSVQLEIARYIREDRGLRNELINSISSFLIV